MNIWFTSDLHYGHANIAGPDISKWKSGYRNFESVRAMNEAIVESLNSRIAENDVLYFLGDWSFGGYDNVRKLRDQVKCQTIYVVLGNHDHHLDKQRELFSRVLPVWEGKIDGNYFVLNHYAQRVWNHSHHGSYHLYGHSHGTLPDEPNALSLDVGWDTALFGHKKHTPYHIDEVRYIMSQMKNYQPVDHHNSETN